MKRTVQKTLACLLAAALLFACALPAFAKNGPYVPQEEEDWEYASLELLELDDKGNTITVVDEEYGYPKEKSLPLYVGGKVTAQKGAVYDKKTNTLTLTDFRGNYALHINLMGDDFKLCIKGNCRLTRIRVYGGGVMQPPWGGSLRITGDGTLTVNPDKLTDSGIFFAPQEEELVTFTVDPTVTLNAYGKVTALEVSSYTGTFKMTVNGKTETVKGEKAVRELTKTLEGFSNPMTWNLALCKNAADPDGVYTIATHTPVIWSDEENTFIPDPDKTPFVVVEKYLYIPSLDAYIRDYDWNKENSNDDGSDDVRYDSMAEAAAAGFTPVLDEHGQQKNVEVNYYGNQGTEEIYRDAKGNEYAVGFGPDDEGHYNTIAMTFTPVPELPGKYLFTYAKGVDPKTLTEIKEMYTFDDMFDYSYPEKQLKQTGSGAPAVKLGDVDFDGEITAADARLALRRAVDLESYAPGSNEYVACNVDRDAEVTAADARLILRAAVDLEDPATW